MMRKLAVLGVLFTLFIGVGLYTEMAIDRSAKELALDLKQLKDLVSQERWKQAASAFDQYTTKWAWVETWWALATDHEEIDEISLGIEKAQAYLASQTKEELLAELNALTYLIQHIPEKEKLTWSTLF